MGVRISGLDVIKKAIDRVGHDDRRCRLTIQNSIRMIGIDNERAIKINHHGSSCHFIHRSTTMKFNRNHISIRISKDLKNSWQGNGNVLSFFKDLCTRSVGSHNLILHCVQIVPLDVDVIDIENEAIFCLDGDRRRQIVRDINLLSEI